MYRYVTLTIVSHPCVTSTERKLSLAGSVQELQQHMVGVGLSEQSSLRCLSKEKGQQVVEYIAGSLFQHYHLFEYLFSEEQQQDHISSRVRECT